MDVQRPSQTDRSWCSSMVPSSVSVAIGPIDPTVNCGLPDLWRGAIVMPWETF
jgi:hypothetical protein